MGARTRHTSRREKAQRFPLRSFTRTAIEIPEFGNHIHQLGSNPPEPKPNYQLYQDLRPTSNVITGPGAGSQGQVMVTRSARPALF